MEKIDVLNIRVSPELKGAFLSEYKDYKIAQAFEMLYMKHLDLIIQDNEKSFANQVKIMNDLKKIPDSSPEAIAIFKKNCEEIKDTIDKYEELREMAFPQFYGTGELGL